METRKLARALTLVLSLGAYYGSEAKGAVIPQDRPDQHAKAILNTIRLHYGSASTVRDQLRLFCKDFQELVTRSEVECLFVLRNSESTPADLLLSAFGEDDIQLPNLALLVAGFREGVANSERVSVDFIHSHRVQLLTRRHSSQERIYRRLRQVLGIRLVDAQVVELQIQRMRSGALPAALIPPSVDDLLTALKVFLLSEPERVEVTFYFVDLEGFWRMRLNSRGRKIPQRLAIEILRGGLFEILTGRASPRGEMERRFSELFKEYFVLRNRIAQAYSEDAFQQFERGEGGGVELERQQAEKRLRRLIKVATQLGLQLEFETYHATECQPKWRPQSIDLTVSRRP